jgi:hypothetical protein
VRVGEPVRLVDRSVDLDGEIVLREGDLDGDGVFDERTTMRRIRPT